MSFINDMNADPNEYNICEFVSDGERIYVGMRKVQFTNRSAKKCKPTQETNPTITMTWRTHNGKDISNQTLQMVIMGY